MKKFLTFFLLFFLVLVLAVPSFAQTATSSPAPTKKLLPLRNATRSAGFVKAYLEGSKLQACNAKSKNIINRSKNLAARSERMVEKFASISARVQKYYLEKLVPQGAVIDNFDELVADVNAKKAAIAPLVDKAKTDAASFSCESEDPVGQLTAYREDMQAVIQALHDYRKAIRDLIVAVAGSRGGLNQGQEATGSGSL